MSTCKPEPARRRRTPEDLKYLLNERAAVAGALFRIQCGIAPLSAELTYAEAKVRALGDELAPLLATQAAHQSNLDALDAVIRHLHPTADPGSAGSVNAHSGRCGKRGELAKYLLSALKQASPEGLTASTLLVLASVKFGFSFDSPQERENFRDGIRRQLRRWRDSDLVRSARSGSNRPTRWHVVDGPAAADLLVHAEAHRDENQDSSGSEVAGQRAGSSGG